MKVIIINGHAESGKSTFVLYCKTHPRADVYEFSMVDAAKSMAHIIGWEEDQKTPKDRKFLSNLKDLIDEYNDGSIEYVDHCIKNFVYLHDSKTQLVIFIHAREPEDIERLVKRYNAKTVVVRRRYVENEELDNHADKFWWAYEYDYVIKNSGSLEDLEKTSVNFMDFILNESFDWEDEE